MRPRGVPRPWAAPTAPDAEVTASTAGRAHAAAPAPPSALPSHALASRCRRDTPSSLAREGDEKLVLATLAAHPREAVRQHSALQVPRLRAAPRTGAGRAPPRSPPPAAWPSCPSSARKAPFPPAASAGTPTRAPPPAPPLLHLSRAHAPLRLPRCSREPWETGELRPLASKRIAPVGTHVPQCDPPTGN